jgi:hypothetical protein
VLTAHQVWIVDFSEYHFGQTSSESKKVSKISMQLLQDHYPERLGVAFIVNPPWYFTLLYKIVRYPRILQIVFFF